MKAVELKKMSVDELKSELMAATREKFNLRMQKATRQLTQNHLLKVVRRKIAQLKTILHEKGQS